jgi:serine/threonine protein kinase
MVKKTRLKTNKTLRKPRVIGKGVSGCVVKPRFRCKNESLRKYKRAKDEVGKIMITAEAKQEEMYMENIKNLDPLDLFTVGIKEVCTPKISPYHLRKKLIKQKCSPTTLMSNMYSEIRQVISKYGGISVNQSETKTFTKSLKEITKSQKEIYSILTTEFIRIIYGILEIQKRGLCHLDLHVGNVLWNKKSCELRIIDFINVNTGTFMVDLKRLPTLIQTYSKYFTTHIYTQYPPELSIIGFFSSRFKHDGIYPIKILSNELPLSIVNAFEDGAEGRSAESLKTATLNLNDVELSYKISKHFFPENIPFGEETYIKRCKAVIGMRELFTKDTNVKDRTKKTILKSIKTLDSYACGIIMENILDKIQDEFTWIDKQPEGVLLREIIHKLTDPKLSIRIEPNIALDTLLKLRASLPKDPRSETNKLNRVL